MSENNHPALHFDPEKPLQVGGQAVIEGVMMRAPGCVATAVRRKGGQIVVKKQAYLSLAEKIKFFKLPVLRGAVGLIEMMVLGVDTLNFSTEVAMRDLAPQGGTNGQAAKKKSSSLRLTFTVVLALALGIGVFFITPLLVTTRLFNVEQTAFGFNLITGAIRLLILVGYLLAITLMKDVRRLFAYHGAEHKAVFTFESGGVLTVSNACRYTRFHPRCGTSFILIVVLVAILLFSILDALMMLVLGGVTLPLRLATHLPLIPLVGGVAYEFIRWSAKRSGTPVGKVLVAPGLWLQRVTTHEPDPAQVEVALVALKCALGVEEPGQATYVKSIAELSHV